MNKEKILKIIAKFIRIISIPPVIITALIFILCNLRNDIFNNNWEILFSVFFLGIVPVLAYPLQTVIPSYKNKGREGQRNLAFIMSVLGYSIVSVLGIIMKSTPLLKTIYITYFISVILLLLFNKVFHQRASGHACSAAAPIVFCVAFLGSRAILPCLILELLIIWSSIYLKRHKLSDVILGTLVCISSFLVSYLILIVIL